MTPNKRGFLGDFQEVPRGDDCILLLKAIEPDGNELPSSKSLAP
jgi:hypothetical protein